MNQRDNALPPHCNALPPHCHALRGYQNALSERRDELPMRQNALPLFSNAMHVHRLFSVVALVVTVSFSGCALTHETGRVFRLAKRTVQIEPRFYEYIKSDRVAQREARLLAEQAWGEIAHAVPNASPDYENGFTEGFADYLYRGGSGEPPLVPPRGYWSLRFLNPQGKMVVEEWFAGFRHGAENCKTRGIRDMWVVPTSFVPEPDPPSARPPIDDAEMKFMNPGPDMNFQQAEPNAEPASELELDESDASPTSETDVGDEAMDEELDASVTRTSDDAPLSGDGDTPPEAPLLDFGGAREVAPEQSPELPPSDGDLKFFDEVDPPTIPEQNEPANNPFRDDEADPFMIPGGDAPDEPAIDFGDFGPINLPEGTTVPANLEPVPRSHGRHPASYIKQTSAQVERKPASRPNKLRQRGNTYRNTYRDVVASASGSRNAAPSASGRPRELPMKLVATPIRKPANNRVNKMKATSPGKTRVEPAMKLEAAPASPASLAPRSNSQVEPFDDSLPSIPLQIDAPRMSLDDLDWNPMKDIATLPSAPGANDWRSAEPTGDASTDAIRWNAEFSHSDELPLQLADRTREMPRVIVGEAVDGRAPMKTDSGVDRGRVEAANGSVDSFLNFESTGRSIRDDLQLMLREANSRTPVPRRVVPSASASNEAFETAALKWRNEK